MTCMRSQYLQISLLLYLHTTWRHCAYPCNLNSFIYSWSFYQTLYCFISMITECPEWRYSSDCSQQCSCDRKTSTGCDEITGDCVCHDGYQGVDCSCHTTVSSCIGPYSKCEYERCTCTDGLFNTPTNCSGIIIIKSNKYRVIWGKNSPFHRPSVCATEWLLLNFQWYSRMKLSL